MCRQIRSRSGIAFSTRECWGLALFLIPVCFPGKLQASGQATTSSLPATAISAPPAAIGASGTETPARSIHRAEVVYKDALLTISANNSSLNQILREIARQTGMKITGGVSEDRVFGVYGPASPAAVLSALLDGTSSNILLVQNAEHKPTELILSPRVGGVTPPNPNASGFDGNDASDDITPPPQRVAAPAPVIPANTRSPYRRGTGGIDTNPAATAPSSTSQQLVFPPVDAATPPSTATTTPPGADPSADTVKTPQQIFEQLQKLRQQQTQQPVQPQ